MYCFNCGAKLNIEINRSFIFCQYCGSKNRIETEEMKTTTKVGNIDITAKTELNNLILSAEYAIDLGQFDRANEMLMTAILSCGDDYRIHVCRAMIALRKLDGKSLFTLLEKLKTFESTQNGNEVATALRKLMTYKGKNDITALHIASHDENYAMVMFCVEHGSDVNITARYATSEVTPISIMFEPTNFKFSGIPFVRNMENVNTIRNYLLQHGAKDKMRGTFEISRHIYNTMRSIFTT
jgi:hypothetical protein